jgi:O-antigen/teichoic acid export membrane protein
LGSGYYLKNGLWVAIRQLVGFITGLVFSVAFARLASSEVFGNYQLVISIIATLAILSIPGLNTSIIQSTARGFDGSYIRSVRISFLWSLLGVPALLVIGAYYYYFQGHAVGMALMVSSVFFPFLYAPNTWDAFFQGKELFRLSTIYSLIQAIINTAAMVAVLIIWKNNLIAITLLYLSSLGLFNILWYQRSKRRVTNTNVDKSTLSYGWFLTKIGILETLSSQMDRIIVGIYFGPKELAVYSIGMTVARKIYDLVKSFLALASPRISRSNTVSSIKYLKIFIATAFLAVILIVLFPFIIPLLYSEKYHESVILSQLSIAFLPFFVLHSLYSTHVYLFLRNRLVIAINSVVTPFVYTGLMIVFILTWGITGLALFSGFFYIVRLLIYLLLTRCVKQKTPKPNTRPGL